MTLDLLQLFSHAIGFLLLVWLLKRFCWGPLLGVLDQRRQRIATGLEEVEQAKVEMARLKTQYEQEISRIEEQARKKLLEAVQEGRRVAAEIEEAARSAAQASLAHAKETLALEVAKAKGALRDQIVALTLEATETLLRARMDMDEGRDRALVEQFLADLDRPPPASATTGQRAVVGPPLAPAAGQRAVVGPPLAPASPARGVAGGLTG